MSKDDPLMLVTCDRCGESDYCEMEYRYYDYSGENGDFKDPFTRSDQPSVARVTSQSNVTFYEWDDDEHYCEDCLTKDEREEAGLEPEEDEE